MENKFLDLIVCPVSKEKLKYDKKNNELISKKAKLAYKVKNGIPILLPEEARKIWLFNWKFSFWGKIFKNIF